MASEYAIVCVHGAGPKPGVDELRELWHTSLRQGLARDHNDLLPKFDSASMDLVYYADRLSHLHPHYDEELDLLQRRKVIVQFAGMDKARDFRRRNYEVLPGKSPLKEFGMDVAAILQLTPLIWPRVMPEMSAYWRDDDGWATDIRRNLRETLVGHLDAGRHVFLISHCLGAVISYDTLWAGDFSSRVQTWVTMGAPLGSSSVRRRLMGADEKVPENLVRSVINWHNLSAEDDYVCHDKTLADDFRSMLNNRVIGDIQDHTIYNLSIRYGRSNPHHSAGYLVHPRTAELLGNWLHRES